MDMNERTVPEQSEGMTAEGVGDWITEKALGEMATEPAAQEMILALQDETCTRLSAIIDETAKLLMQNAEHSTKMRAPLAELQPARLGDASKRRRQAWQEAREVAEMLVVGTLLNKNNPAWDPTDPSSCATEGQSTLLSLIRFTSAEEGMSASAV